VTRIRVTTPSKAVGAMRLGFMCERRRRSAVVERGGGRGWGSAATSLGGRLLWVAVVWYRVRVCGLLWGRHQRPSLGYIGGSGGRGAVVGDGATRASPQCRGGAKRVAYQEETTGRRRRGSSATVACQRRRGHALFLSRDRSHDRGSFR
jgi:hypothetical protein